MSLTLHGMMLYACVTFLLLQSLHTTHNHVTAAPTTWSGKSTPREMADNKATYLNLVKAMMHRLQDSKDKRARADGGFFSRHDAMSDYLQSAYANSLAMDLYGPGKRK